MGCCITRSRASLVVIALALLSACSGTDCGPKGELRAGDPCGERLFTYCPENLACCVSGTSSTPICATESQCRAPLLGELCGDEDLWSRIHHCDYDLTCQDGRCVCVTYCSSNATVCWIDEAACVYQCCTQDERCGAGGWCVSEHPKDLGPWPDMTPWPDAASDGPRDARVETRRDAGSDLPGAELGGGVDGRR
jgi:hypothetical protein